MNYNWDWGIFLAAEPGGTGTYLKYLVVGLGWTLATALAAWVIALLIGSVIGTLRTTPHQWIVRLGNAYVDVTPQAGDPARIAISLENADPSVTWVVQVVPGAGGDGDILDLGAGPRTVAVPGPRTVIVTALPRGADDPDDRTDARHTATLVIAAR